MHDVYIRIVTSPPFASHFSMIIPLSRPQQDIEFRVFDVVDVPSLKGSSGKNLLKEETRGVATKKEVIGRVWVDIRQVRICFFVSNVDKNNQGVGRRG